MTDQNSGLTFAEAIRVASEKLRDVGVQDARYEARLILQWSTNSSPADIISREYDFLSLGEYSTWQMAVRHRQARRPLAHLEGYAHFYGITLRSDSRALIPRPDSECVVELALSLLPPNVPLKIADLGTGTGALLAAILTHRPQATGTAVERSQQAATLAGENFKALSIAHRTSIFRGSWIEWQVWGDCDLIISNPPYIESAVIPTLQPEVRDHDPMDALDGGVDGLDAYREIISLGAQHMKSGAFLVLEIGFDQKETVTDLLIKAGFLEIQHRKDLGGNDRAIAAKRP